MTTVNLFIRFLLEMTALVVCGMWGWQKGNNVGQYLFAILLPTIYAGLWGTVAVPGDPSRSGRALFPVPGWVRLALEIFIFGSAVWFLVDLRYPMAGTIMGIITISHYLASFNRISWLLKNNRSG